MVHRLAPEAVADLDGIWYYVATETGSSESADRLLDAITRRFLLLTAYPHLGRRRDDLRAGLRSFVVENYVILYRTEGEDVLILHVLHGRRDIDAVFAP